MIEKRDPYGIASDAADWLSELKESELKESKLRKYEFIPSVKTTALRLLSSCHDSDPPIAPPEELIRLIECLFFSGRRERKTRENPFQDDPTMEREYREMGRGWGFLKPQPENVLLIQDRLIPFEAQHDPDPTGERPSVASDKDVADHLEKQTAQVKKWRKMPRIIDEVQWYREDLAKP